MYDIACDGAVLSDTLGRIESLLAGVRYRLEKRGALQSSFRGMPYWVLDPDVRPGQVVEI